jgi:hypothetical protein
MSKVFTRTHTKSRQRKADLNMLDYYFPWILVTAPPLRQRRPARRVPVATSFLTMIPL